MDQIKREATDGLLLLLLGSPLQSLLCITIGNINVKTGYKFNVTEGTNQFAYGAGRGYTREIRNGNEVIVAKWYGIGTARGASAASRRNTPWGNVAGYRVSMESR